MIFIMAWRNIWRNKTRSIIIMFSISLGLFAGIAVLALYKGMMVSRVRTLIDTEVGHLQMHDMRFTSDQDPAFIIPGGEKIIQDIGTIPGVKTVSARSLTNGMLATASGSSGVQIIGVIPDREYYASQLDKKILEGKRFDSSRHNQVMIGKKLAKKMKIRTGSKTVLTFTDSAGNMVAGAFRVAAIYQSDNAPRDEKLVYVDRKDLNELLTTGNSFHEISIILNKDQDVDTIQSLLKKEYHGLQTETWREISPETDLMVRTVDQYSYIIMVIIMLALAFGIINTMLMTVLERTREIGMMVALGTNRIRIFSLVLMETFFLTLAGTPFGILAGWLVTGYFNKQGLDLSGMGKEMMSSFGFGTLIYPEFPVEKLGGILLIVSGTALLSCLFPAIKALKLQPVEALRR